MTGGFLHLYIWEYRTFFAAVFFTKKRKDQKLILAFYLFRLLIALFL